MKAFIVGALFATTILVAAYIATGPDKTTVETRFIIGRDSLIHDTTIVGVLTYVPASKFKLPENKTIHDTLVARDTIYTKSDLISAFSASDLSWRGRDSARVTVAFEPKSNNFNIHWDWNREWIQQNTVVVQKKLTYGLQIGVGRGFLHGKYDVYFGGGVQLNFSIF